MVETLAELPFIGDQVVCSSHDQAWTIIPPGAKLRASLLLQNVLQGQSVRQHLYQPGLRVPCRGWMRLRPLTPGLGF